MIPHRSPVTGRSVEHGPAAQDLVQDGEAARVEPKLGGAGFDVVLPVVGLDGAAACLTYRAATESDPDLRPSDVTEEVVQHTAHAIETIGVAGTGHPQQAMTTVREQHHAGASSK